MNKARHLGGISNQLRTVSLEYLEICHDRYETGFTLCKYIQTYKWLGGLTICWRMLIRIWSFPSLQTVSISNVNFPQKYLYHQSWYSNTWDSSCLALIAQMVRAFGMNSKIGGSGPLQVETFSVSKTLTLSQERPFVCQKWMPMPEHSYYFKC